MYLMTGTTSNESTLTTEELVKKAALIPFPSRYFYSTFVFPEHPIITVPRLALLGQVFSSLVRVVCYLGGGPLDNLFQLRFQPLHYGFDGLGDFLQLGQSLKKEDDR